MSLEAGLALCRPFGEEGRMAAALKRAVWTQRRTYRPRADGKVKLPKEFDAILTRITAGERIAAPELLPYLCLEERAQRAEVNAQLADAYFHASTPEHIAQAKIFAQRAWLLTGFSAELLPLYTRILSATGDTERIREAYKRAGIEAGRQGRIADALRFFELWQYAYHEFDHVDRYEYDFDIMHCVNDLAAPHRFAHDPAQALAPGEKIRLACLVRGMMEINSILIKIDLELAKYRDRSRFDVTIFVPESRAAVLASPQGRDHIAAFEALDYPVVTASDSDNTEEMLLDIAGRIKDFNPHIMVTSAALADFSHYFITSLRPAPIQVGLVQGAPAQFAPPTLDWCIAWTRHPLLDCPVDSSWVRIYLDWPSCDGIAGYNRSEMGIPEDACVLLSGGRQAKFQDPEFWKIIAELLAEHPNAHYLAVGPLMNQIPVFTEIVPQELKPRIRCLGWREDFLRILRIADIAIDTYPNGGGQVVVQAMSMGIPIVAHRNDYMQPFTQTAWSPAEDFLNETDLLVPRGDFARFKQIISRLIEDPQYRREAGERCRAQHVKQADPTAAVRRCEEIYTELVERHLAAQPGSDGARD
ncbi:MAG TPA: glycosyltransferase [Pyrinomonadaceae bacterium]|jgi:hypothetical protein